MIKWQSHGALEIVRWRNTLSVSASRDRRLLTESRNLVFKHSQNRELLIHLWRHWTQNFHPWNQNTRIVHKLPKQEVNHLKQPKTVGTPGKKRLVNTPVMRQRHPRDRSQGEGWEGVTMQDRAGPDLGGNRGKSGFHGNPKPHLEEDFAVRRIVDQEHRSLTRRWPDWMVRGPFTTSCLRRHENKPCFCVYPGRCLPGWEDARSTVDAALQWAGYLFGKW